MSAERAVVFDIKEFAVHDGPGVRTTVFFKGYPLRCVWCHNPEGLSSGRQLMIRHTRCRRCGKCRVPCGHEECRSFDGCIYACPDALITVCGKEITADALTKRLLRDADFLRESGGGVTFSGGEPLMQWEFLLTMLQRLRAASVHTAVETSGFAEPSVFRQVTERADLLIMDLKLSDPALHKKYTGADNVVILKNALYLRNSGKAHMFRTPLIPGITDTTKNLSAIAEIIGDSPRELLPHNALAGAKYPMLGMAFPYDSIKDEE